MNKERFLRECSDILHLPLDVSHYSLTPKKVIQLEEEFLSGKPFAYQLKQAEFYHHRFFVNEHVLIPRPETELLVDHVIRAGTVYPLAVDVGCGSGVILLSLLKAGVVKRGVAVDLSAQALEVAKINARNLRVLDKVEFIQADRLNDVDQLFDLVVSNPPYIKAKAHKDSTHASILHEPDMALYLPDEAYDTWFSQFFQQVKGRLKPGGLFLMEGHEDELPFQRGILDRLGFDSPAVLNDFTGRNRFLRAFNSR